MSDAFESLDEFRDVMETLLNMRAGNLYGLIAGQPNADKDWDEITRTVADAGFALTWLTRELENAARNLDLLGDLAGSTPKDRLSDPRYVRAADNWRRNRQIAFSKTDHPSPRAN